MVRDFSVRNIKHKNTTFFSRLSLDIFILIFMTLNHIFFFLNQLAMGSIEPTNQSVYGSLSGKVALVTGSGRGIGRGIALELAKRGASVVVNYANSSKPAQEAVKEIESTGTQAIAVQGDMTKVADIRRVFKEAIDHFGRLDIVMSNSGTESFQKEEDVTEEDYDKVFALNTRAQFFVAQEALKTLQHGGRIILMSSVAATSKFPSKAGFILQGCQTKNSSLGPNSPGLRMNVR
jgi:NADP-dependent 3-hydroxy acid dehydrogenase YdfG